MAFKKIRPTTSAYSYQLLIKELLRFPLLFSGDQEIVYRDKIRYSYSILAKRIAKLANLLTQLGVKPGDTVAMMDWDSHRYLECYFAVPMMGAVLHMVNIRLSPEQMVYTINHAEDGVILINADFLPMLEGMKDQFETDKKIVLLSDEALLPPSNLAIHGEYETLLEKSSDTFDFPDFDEDTIATVFYTTGTTGRPKGVYFSHRQLVLHTLGIISELSGYKTPFTVQSDDVYMPMTPMFHVHAWGLPYMMTALGTKQVYPGKYEPEMLLTLVGTEKVTFSHCVPTILHMLLDTPLINEIDVNGWKMIVGGSALSKGLCQAAMERGINLVTGYGLSETCPVMTLSFLKPHMMDWSMEEQIEVRCRTGLPTPFVHVEIVDPLGNPLPHDGLSVGEVVVRSPWLTQGYLKEAELSEKLWKDSWLRTGDIGYFTEDGYLQVTDRIKDVIKTGGEWVSSLELEDIISQHEAVSEAAVIGVPDDKWGERPLVLVVLKEEYREKVNENELRDFFIQAAEKGRIARYAVPYKILIVDVISKTSVGKLNKRSMRNQLGM
jgi:fatty-acyl-CoA synthase